MNLFGFTIIGTRELELLKKRISRAKKENEMLLVINENLIAGMDELLPLYNKLPCVFTREMLSDKIKKFGLKSPVRKFIYSWKKKGIVEETEYGIYSKTNKTCYENK